MERSILLISDQHIPHHHQDMMAFLRAIKKKYKPTRIVNIGNDLALHSFHTADLVLKY